jgi:hypothetical protein
VSGKRTWPGGRPLHAGTGPAGDACVQRAAGRPAGARPARRRAAANPLFAGDRGDTQPLRSAPPRPGSYPLAVSVKARRGAERASRAASSLHRDGPTGTAPRAGCDGGRSQEPSAPALLQATTTRTTTSRQREPAQRPRLALPHDRLAGRVDTVTGQRGRRVRDRGARPEPGRQRQACFSKACGVLFQESWLGELAAALTVPGQNSDRR